MKSRFALLLAVCLSVFGWSYMTAPSPTSMASASDETALAAAAPRAGDGAATRGAPRSESPFLNPNLVAPADEPQPTTTTTAAPTTTTTAKPKPKPKPTTTVTTAKPKPKPAPAKPKVEQAASTKKSATKAASGNYSALINQYDWDTAKAHRIMMCESGGNPNAVNKSSGATGLFQIHPGGAKYKDPATNVAAAYAKYQARGWKPWVCKG